MNWDQAVRQQWEQDGVLRGRLTEEEWLADGRWLIGSRLPDGHPGHVEGWCYKSFVARPERYAPGVYPWKQRVADNEWEFVAVSGGNFVVEVRYSDWQFPIQLGPSAWVDLPPQPERRWVLASGEKVAWGCGLLRRLPAGLRPARPGGGEHYEFHLGVMEDLPLSHPNHLTDWRVCFAEVFDGCLGYCHATARGVQILELRPKEHVFLARQTNGSFGIVSRSLSRGTVIYY